MKKRKHNPKRRISPSVDSESLGRLVKQVVYTGNPAHKRNPGDYKLTPPANPRANKTLCDVTEIFELRQALKLLRKGIAKGLVSVRIQNGFPQNVWAVSANGYAVEAQLENAETGAYHGYPMDIEDPLAAEVKRKWKGIAFVNNDFCISVEEWLASDATDPFERDTNADFSITIGQNRATEVEDIQAGTVRKTIRASAGLLAIWLADNWWRLTCEPDSLIARNKDLNWRMSHTCTAIGGGYVWPNLIFGGSDGSSISIECKSSIEKEAAKYSPIRYLNSFSSIVSCRRFQDRRFGFC